LPAEDGGEPYFLTGDVGRFRPDGCLEHLGRKDGVVKLRGMSIEPAQIEAVLMGEPRLRECVVGVCGEGSGPKRLAAWIVPAPGATLPAAELRERVAAALPPACVPSVFVPMRELPLTPGGKVDRRALRTPAASAAAASDAGAAPRDGIELTLSRLWEKLLRARHVAPGDDFFERGGDSLLAAVMLTRVESVLGVDVPIAGFAAAPTVAGLARLIRGLSVDPVHRRLVRVVDGGSLAPLFWVPGAGVVEPGGGSGAWVAGMPRPHYQFQFHGIDGVEPAMRTVEAMAESFVAEIRNVQPAGPYLLGGGSFGALVALAAAHLLCDAGDEVGVVVVEDCLLDGCLRARPSRTWRERGEALVLWLMPVGRRFEFTRAGLRDGLRQWRYRVLLPLVRWWSRRRRVPLPKVYRFHDVLGGALRAKRRHVPRPYPGRVVLLRTGFQSARRLFEVDPTLGWSRVCPNLECHDLTGEKGERVHDPARQAEFLERIERVLGGAGGG
jgi:hypothetical protein